MKKDEYKELTEIISDMLSEKFFETEKELAKMARTLDQDISEIFQVVGSKTTKKVMEKARDEIVEKKVRRIDDTQEPFD